MTAVIILRSRATRPLAALAGIVAAAIALGVAEVAAAFVGPSSSPLTAVAGEIVDRVPRSVEQFGVQTFGSWDKPVLTLIILVVLAGVAAVTGALAARHIGFGLGVFAAFAAIGAAACVSRPDSTSFAVVPTLVGAGVAMGVLSLLVGRARDAGAALDAEAAERVAAADSHRTAEPADVGGTAGSASSAGSESRAVGAGGTVGSASSAGSESRAVGAGGTVGSASSAGSESRAVGAGGTAGSASSAGSESRAVGAGGTVGSASSAGSESRAVGAGGTAGSASPAPWLVGGGGAASRRTFFWIAGGAATAAVAAGGVGRLLARWRGVSDQRAAIRLPAPASPAPPVPAGASLDVPGITPLTTANDTFYRVDTAFVLPQVDPRSYRLRIHGRVRRELTLTYQDLLDLPLVERDITLACVSNEVGGDLLGNARWLGVRLADVLDRADPHPDADQLVGRSADGWTCGTPTAACRDGRDALLAVGMNGVPLPIAHGFPVRMVVPGLYGYVSATKWLVDLELSRFDDFDAYWVPRGWSQQAPIKTSSRIDTPRQSDRVSGTVTVAGVAWAQRRGISRVEVRVDGGQWQQATLADADSVDTWRQWRWDWDATEAGGGRHTLEVRATDATGAIQSGTERPPAPNGSEGWHQVSVTAR
ncbi:molybdopterin-dependent oxidoreductase [Cryptosporangium aurantiacum]|uniref:DMSO/TMAO reductase YedYZ, molybdopterin-dependent catalytic subunit n=1 Tax=Cryptosporangium aurantiacum TaxID=134849 RepID=A0A1M7RHD5_9ACTN|nr:molybdopterin-dependent oxidoreductase [Cryptosporangium aurantiacum]SHN45569.1 DMSO/TMAO reductase YedYZ, molybdopterin-dependent catalytic subunit [Cryptosporangium aurantiacum]